MAIIPKGTVSRVMTTFSLAQKPWICRVGVLNQQGLKWETNLQACGGHVWWIRPTTVHHISGDWCAGGKVACCSLTISTFKAETPEKFPTSNMSRSRMRSVRAVGSGLISILATRGQFTDSKATHLCSLLSALIYGRIKKYSQMASTLALF